MSGKNRIVAIETGSEVAAPEEMLLTDEVVSVQPAGEPEADAGELAPIAGRAWLVPSLAGLAIAAWTGFFVWAHREDTLLDAPLTAWIDLVRDWSLPVLLLCVVWLLAMRNSRREAARFGDAARLLSNESARLEDRLKTVNGELSLAREFIGAQSRDLEALGRVAAERLSQNAGRLQELINDNSAHVDTIFTISTAALENMEKLRAQLPVVATSARDVTSNIGNAGRTAHSQLQEMIQGFKRLNEFGAASERQVQTLRMMVDEALGEFTVQAQAIESVTQASFAELAKSGPEFRAQLEVQQVQAIAAIREQAQVLAEELESSHAQLDAQKAGAFAAIRQQAQALSEEIAGTQAQFDAQKAAALAAISEQAQALALEIAETTRLRQEQEEAATATLAARLAALRDEGEAISSGLRSGEESALSAWQEAVARMDQDVSRLSSALAEADARAMDMAKSRLATLAEEAGKLDTNIAQRNRHFAGELEKRQKEAQQRESDAVEQLRQRLADIDAETEAHVSRQAGHAQQLTDQGEILAANLGELEARIAAIAEHGDIAGRKLSAGLEALTGNLATSRQTLSGTDKEIAEITDASVRLLELIQAGSQHSREILAQAIAENARQLDDVSSRVLALRDTAGEAGAHGEALSGHVAEATHGLETAMARLEELRTSLAKHAGAHAQVLETLQAKLDAIDAHNGQLSSRAHDELSAAIAVLASKSQEAIADIERLSGSAVTKVSTSIGEEARHALDAAVTERMALVAGDLEAATERAASASREAALQLRDQLAKVNDLAGNLERRVTHARERAEEQVDNDFSRRVALINESLNSHAIDIAKALDSDVSDTAWASYLRGDRGIFTRRAVTLLESGEARAIAQLYESDSAFRDHVSHYIHDFEAMLRQILSTRDGHALGVTLLSSDMGKLYVALAQAIERLRS